MILLNVQNVLRQFDTDPILNGISFEVRPGEKIGLVGPNGVGKTTLFRILAGVDEPDQGEVHVHPSARLAMLDQTPQFEPDRTLLDEAKSGLAPLYGLQAEAQEMADNIATETDPALHARWQKRYDQLQAELTRLSAYNIDHRVDEVLQGLGFTPDQYHRPLGTFSGGQINRVSLARVLLSAPDLMLLDEPTNHLDIAATEWLEQYLSNAPQAMILVSHDRYFLDKVTNRILELYAAKVTDYPGNFSAYWKQKEERKVVLERAYEKQQEFIAKTEDFIRRNHYGQKHQQAHDRERKLERIERIDRPQDIPQFPMDFGKPRRTGDWVIEAQGLTKGFNGPPLFRDVDIMILRGDRVGLFGPNGSGKSTLLKTLLGQLEPDAGKVRFGTNVDLAYYDQGLESVDPELNIVDAIRPARFPNMLPAQLRDILAKFGLRGDIVFQKVGNLSGGEMSKAALARIAALNANLLVLDEPTNHLDLWARASLEEALREFEGTLIFVSHDRYFLDRVATKIFAFEPTRWRLFEGNYSHYTDSLRRAAEEAKQLPSRGKTADKGAAGKSDEAGTSGRNDGKAPRRKRQFPYRKVADLEADIAAAEAQFAQLEQDLGNPDIYRDGNRAKETRLKYEETQNRITQLYAHWEEAVELNS